MVEKAIQQNSIQIPPTDNGEKCMVCEKIKSNCKTVEIEHISDKQFNCCDWCLFLMYENKEITFNDYMKFLKTKL